MKTKIKTSMGRKVFLAADVVTVVVLSVLCMIPLLNLLAISFSSSQAIIENKVTLFPVDFTLNAYEYVVQSRKFWTSVRVSLLRVLLGVPVNVLMTILAAYPLSKDPNQFRARRFYVAYMMIVMLFNGGLMPTYYVVAKTGLIDSVWSLVLPGAVPVFSCIVLLNFFRGIPSELEESAKLDGAGQWTILTKIYLPLSKPSIATVTLFSLVNHWNSYFDGLIYSNRTQNYPLQSYLQTIVVSTTDLIKNGDIDALMKLTNINDINMRAAQVFISVVPLMAVYPFLQKYFTMGLVLGSVKG